MEQAIRVVVPWVEQAIRVVPGWVNQGTTRAVPIVLSGGADERESRGQRGVSECGRCRADAFKKFVVNEHTEPREDGAAES